MDIYHLIQIVQAEVEKQFEVTLETEIELIGNFDVE
jgi:UDP-N-acetylenolpyruvoylglucosamine reductase